MDKAGKILGFAMIAVAVAGPALAHTPVQSRLGFSRSAHLIVKINRAYGTQFAVPAQAEADGFGSRTKLASARDPR